MFISNETKKDILSRLKRMEKTAGELQLEIDFIKSENLNLKKRLRELEIKSNPIQPITHPPMLTPQQPGLGVDVVSIVTETTHSNKPTVKPQTKTSDTYTDNSYLYSTYIDASNSHCNSGLYDSGNSCDSSSSSCCD